MVSSSTATDPLVKDPLKNAWATDSDNRDLGSARGGDDPKDDLKTNRTGAATHDITQPTGLDPASPNYLNTSSSNEIIEFNPYQGLE